MEDRIDKVEELCCDKEGGFLALSARNSGITYRSIA